MAQTIIMPKLGLTMTYGRINHWTKKVGDPVKIGDIIVEIETDKINFEVESTFNGYLIRILVQEDEEVDITTPICIIGEKHELDKI